MRWGDGFAFGVAEDFCGGEALELRDGEGLDGCGDGVPLGGVGEGEGEVALDGLVAGEIVGGDSFEGERVERGEVELREVDGLAELAAVGFGGGSSPKWAMGVVVEEGGGGSAGLEPGGGFGGEGEGWRGLQVRGEEGEDRFDCAFEFEDGGVLRGVERGGLRLRGGEAEGELRGLVDFACSCRRPVVPVKIWPCSKRRTSLTSRLRLWASIVTMPGMSEGRSKRGLFGERVFDGDGAVPFGR